MKAGIYYGPSTSIHLERPVFEVDPEECRELSAVQVARGLYLPVLASPVSPDYGICEIDYCDTRNLLLTVKDNIAWSNSDAITAAEVKLGMIRGFRSDPALAALLGINNNSFKILDKNHLMLNSSKNHVRLIIKALEDLRFAPSKIAGGTRCFTGPFTVSEDPVRAIYALNGRCVSIYVEEDADRTIAAFDAGIIDTTSPTAFEVAVRAHAHPAFQSCVTNIHAFIFSNPDRVGVCSSAVHRARLSQSMRYPPVLESILIPARYEADMHICKTDREKTYSILFSDYYPNFDIAKSFAQASNETGIAKIIPKAVPLHCLVDRFKKNDYDFILILMSGIFEREHSSAIFLSTIAKLGLDPKYHPLIHEYFDNTFHKINASSYISELNNKILEMIPVIPVGNFVSGYLSRAEGAFKNLVNHSIFPIEMLGSTI